MTQHESDRLGSGGSAGLRDRAGQYLTFALGNEVYGLEILKVQEIIGMTTVTKGPRTPDFLRGVINLRGKVIPVVDLRTKFGMESHEDTNLTCIIVVQVMRDNQQVTMGVIVDEVAEVLDVRADQIEPPPTFGTSTQTEFISGMGKVGSKVIILLDTDRVLSWGEVDAIAEVATST
ncbi:MAG: purine-binding chemotaxis protein CheW [Candidatus Hydrogenedentes bacterium]|nr:purine-binding chemotaxis protein CheW [Candidatus Hydrogenedentota bacterium]